MPSIRRSGGAVLFFYEGKLPAPDEDAFSAALQNRRFRTIEDAASEEISAGWITPVDPTGDSFAQEDMDAGAAVWLRVRIDKKQLPRKWLQIHRDVAAETVPGDEDPIVIDTKMLLESRYQPQKLAMKFG